MKGIKLRMIIPFCGLSVSIRLAKKRGYDDFLPKSMNLYDYRGCKNGEASLDGLLTTSRQPSLQPIFSYLIWAYI